jgi:hypothetical protein
VTFTCQSKSRVETNSGVKRFVLQEIAIGRIQSGKTTTRYTRNRMNVIVALFKNRIVHLEPRTNSSQSRLHWRWRTRSSIEV